MKNMPHIVSSYAVYSPCKLYRYRLVKSWEPDTTNERLLLWIMLNPSTATENTDDNTVRKCQRLTMLCERGEMGFFDGVVIANLFALRSTDPRALDPELHSDPVGPDNDTVLDLLISRHPNIVLAWGSHKHRMLASRAEYIAKLLKKYRRRAWCLGVNNDGNPKHPLYLSLDTSFTEYRYGKTDKR